MPSPHQKAPSAIAGQKPIGLRGWFQCSSRAAIVHPPSSTVSIAAARGRLG